MVRFIFVSSGYLVLRFLLRERRVDQRLAYAVKMKSCDAAKL
jgi:hypothetical protein